MTSEVNTVPRIDELAGWVSQRRALEMLDSPSKAWLNDLVRAGKIRAVKWDERTLMYNKRSLEHYLETKQTKRKSSKAG